MSGFMPQAYLALPVTGKSRYSEKQTRCPSCYKDNQWHITMPKIRDGIRESNVTFTC